MCECVAKYTVQVDIYALPSPRSKANDPKAEIIMPERQAYHLQAEITACPDNRRRHCQYSIPGHFDGIDGLGTPKDAALLI